MQRDPANDAVPGARYGRLTVIRDATEHGIVRWLCRCDCGNEAKPRAADIRRGLTQSCGCLIGDTFRALQPNLGRKWNHSHPGKGKHYGPYNWTKRKVKAK